jgi:cytochrome c-type biogenesis protein CcmH
VTFWILAAVALFAAALVTFLPLLRGKSLWQPAALALTFLLPAAGLWIYGEVGTPEAIDLPSTPASTPAPHAAATGAGSDAEIDTMIGGLRARLTNAPEDLDGWMLLARTLKTVQRYPEALDALQVANGIAPDNPAVMVELAEAQIFVSANGQIDSDSIAMLERAIEMDPGQQKGLWLLGIAAAQGGDLDGALAYWETLLAQLEPGSPVAQSVQTQIDEANARLGRPVEPQAAPPTAPATTPATAPVAQELAAASEPVGDGSWRGTPVRIAASDEARAKIPTGATMFVIIRSPGPAMGPPLGVRRVVDPLLPLDITINDQDSMLKERKISLAGEVQLQARLSLSGSPAAASGDWQSAPVVVPLSASGTVELILDQQVE